MKPRIFKKCGMWYVQINSIILIEIPFWTWAVKEATGYLPLPMYILAVIADDQKLT